jgi:methionine synthase II (cobalamin-independent)
MPTVSKENYARILREAEEGARVAARALGREVKDLEHGGYRTMTADEVKAREKVRIRRAIEYAEWRIDAYEKGECASPW